jgi:hypothetical protein
VRPFIRRWLVIFAALTGLMWVMALPLAALRWDANTALLFATAGALGTGIIAVAIAIVHDTVARRGLGSESASPRQHRSLLTSRSADEAFRIVQQLLKGQSWIRVKEEDPGKRLLVARTRASLSSFGERLVVEVSRAESGTTAVTMTSEPLVRTTLIDWGKNWRNLEHLQRLLQQHLA